MKPAFLIFCALVLSLRSNAAVVYSGLQNVLIPLTIQGVYLNVDTGATASSQPGTWNTAPWFNPFLGGTSVANGALFCPVIDAPSHPINPDTIVNLAFGTLIDATLNYTGGENVSSGHTAAVATPNKFTLGQPGYVGFKFQTAPASASYYGWAQVVFNNTGTGTIIDWAYDDSASTPISAGFTGAAVPEPSRAMLVLTGLLAATLRRRRRC